MQIEDLSSSGDGIGSIDGKKVFVTGALPGEVVEIRITEEKKRYAKAKLLKIIQPAKNRVQPICPLFGTCGGCQIMHLDYPAQIAWKQKRVADALSRIGGITADVSPCIPSPDSLGYRNKIHLHEGGFHKRHSHEIIPISKCYIHNALGEKFLPKVKGSKEAIIRTSLATGEVLLEIDGSTNREYLIETLGDLTFKIRSRDFFQINPKQALQLYQKAVECAHLTPSMQVLDAYCGVGCLSLFAAKKGGSVLGIESGRTAIKSAKENAALNKLKNVSFLSDQVERQLPKLGRFDVIFLNPPRAGVHPLVLETLLEFPPDRLIYISCDPATLARDLKSLQKNFTIQGIFPFDMFPQTIHVETIVSLKNVLISNKTR